MFRKSAIVRLDSPFRVLSGGIQYQSDVSQLKSVVELAVRRAPTDVGGNLNDHLPGRSGSWKVIVLDAATASRVISGNREFTELVAPSSVAQHLGVRPDPFVPPAATEPLVDAVSDDDSHPRIPRTTLQPPAPRICLLANRRLRLHGLGSSREHPSLVSHRICLSSDLSHQRRY